MTPPDSGERCGICKRPTRPERLTEVQPASHASGYCWRKEPAPWHAEQCDAIAAMHRPDSGEREVWAALERQREVIAAMCDKHRAHALANDIRGLPGLGPHVPIPLPLVQRILAALEDSLYGRPIGYPRAEAIAAELRKVMPKEPPAP